MSKDTKRAADAPPFTHALPSTGGSFVVQKDGSLKEETAPAEEAASEAPRDPSTDTPHETGGKAASKGVKS